jgi:hypothetical protein
MKVPPVAKGVASRATKVTFSVKILAVLTSRDSHVDTVNSIWKLRVVGEPVPLRFPTDRYSATIRPHPQLSSTVM